MTKAARAKASERARPPPEPTPAAPSAAAAADQAERTLGRWVSIGLPLVTVGAAIVVGEITSPWRLGPITIPVSGPAILVMAAGGLLGTIALFWASVRTLSGDAPLPVDLEEIAARRHVVDAVAEKKNTILRALKDLEHEHSVGKMDDADYAELSAEYRSQAKDLMREMDSDIEPLRARAEHLALAHLRRRGLLPTTAEDASANLYRGPSAHAPDTAAEPVITAPTKIAAPPELADGHPAVSASGRVECTACGTPNDADAAFCKKCGKSVNTSTTGRTDAPA